MLDAILDLVLPRACAVCGIPGSDLCGSCRRDLRRTKGPGCRRCGHPWGIDVDSCAQCPAQLDRVWHGVDYDPCVSALVHAFKDRGRRRIADVLAELVVEHVPPQAGVLVPVAATPGREGARGFNPAAEIARRLGTAWEVPVESILTRAGLHREQRGASRTDRRLQVRGAFDAADCRAWPAVTIVDDVLTTGATLEACARALRRAGAVRVVAVVAARVCVSGGLRM